jgi:hypothetical protein
LPSTYKKLSRIRPRRVFILSAILVQIIVYGVLWMQMITDNALRTGTDFIIMFTAGTLAQREGFPSVYDIDKQREVQEEQVGFELAPDQVLPFNHLPFLIPLLQVLVTSSFPISFVRWEIIILITLFISANLLYLIVKPLQGSRLLTYCSVMLFFPTFIILLMGQDTAFVILGLVVFIYFFSQERDFLAGCGLALATFRPHIVLVLAIPYLFKRRRVFLGFFTLASGLALFSFFLLGENGIHDFINLLLISASGNWYGMNPEAMLNIHGGLIRIFPQKESIVLVVTWLIYIGAIVGLSIWWARSKTISYSHIGTAIILSILFAPHLHYHDLGILIVPIYFLLFVLKDQVGWSSQKAELIPMIYSLIMLIGFSPPIRFITPYLVIISLGLGLWKPEWFQKVINFKPGFGKTC